MKLSNRARGFSRDRRKTLRNMARSKAEIWMQTAELEGLGRDCDYLLC